MAAIGHMLDIYFLLRGGETKDVKYTVKVVPTK